MLRAVAAIRPGLSRTRVAKRARSANRRAIAEARVDREIARARFETEFKLLVGRWAASSAQAEAFAAQEREMSEQLVPLVSAQLEDAFELMRLGEGSSLVLLESITRAYRTKLDWIDARAAEARARAELAFLIGPEDIEAPPPAQEEQP